MNNRTLEILKNNLALYERRLKNPAWANHIHELEQDIELTQLKIKVIVAEAAIVRTLEYENQLGSVMRKSDIHRLKEARNELRANTSK